MRYCLLQYQNSQDDFSSAYGPRAYGGYDFHPGIDIGAPVGTPVLAMYSGIVRHIGSTGTENENIVIESTSGTNTFYIRYMHINEQVYDNQSITAGTQIGTVRQFGNSGHLDIRFYDEGSETPIYNHNEYADNPGIMIGEMEDYDGEPKLVDIAGNEVYDGYFYNIQPADQNDVTPYDSRRYFSFGVRVEDDELDLDGVFITLSGMDAQGNELDEGDLLLNASSIWPDNPGEVWFSPPAVNCGDGQTEKDDGHFSSSVGIYPRGFSRNDPYHTVYFRWYINEAKWYSVVGNIDIEIVVEDWYHSIQQGVGFVWEGTV